MEREFIRWLQSQLPAAASAPLGITDDAAVIPWPHQRDLVVTTDTVTDQVDFVLEQIDPAAAGHKALGVNLSDLAAMAAEPVAAFIALALPRNGAGGLTPLALAQQLYRGILPLAAQFDVVIAGGDTNVWGGGLVISITAMGRTTARGPLTRTGARPGDVLLTTGALGGSILGRHLQVAPRIQEALALHQRYELAAGMDISDGLALDASRLAAASGCGVALRLADVPIHSDAIRLAATTGRDPLDHALGDGEDFELLIAASPREAERMLADQPLDVPLTSIGQFVETAGLWQVDSAGQLAPLSPTGFEH